MKIRLSLSPSYCPSWGTWEAVRELVQNWLDGRDQGYEGNILFNGYNNTLTLTNEGVILSKAQLGMLGETSKADNAEMRGHWGEGLKVGALVLAREGRELVVDSGEYRYTAIIDYSEEFGKDCLTWNCRHLPKSHYNGVKIVVSGVSKQMWESYRNNFLVLREKQVNLEKNFYGNLLMDPEDKGKIFVKGIYVNTDEKLSYGYNFFDVKIDRDRRMVQDFNLTYNTGWILADALRRGHINTTAFLNMVQSGAKDTLHIQYHIGLELAEKLAKDFTRIYGDNAVPTKDHDGIQKLGHFGLKGVIVPNVLFEVLDKTSIGMNTAMRKVSNSDINPCTIDKLSKEAAANVRKVMDLLRKSNLKSVKVDFDMKDDSLTFVDFRDENVRGSFCQGNIKISKKILDDTTKLLYVLVEEIAHEKGVDGSTEHKHQIHDIYKTIITQGLKAF